MTKMGKVVDNWHCDARNAANPKWEMGVCLRIIRTHAIYDDVVEADTMSVTFESMGQMGVVGTQWSCSSVGCS